MDKEREELVMNLIVDAGSARSHAMQAIYLAKQGKFKESEECLEHADQDISKAHAMQTDLIQNEARGNKTEIDLFMVHAQDHIMTAMLAKDMAREMVELYKKVS